MYKNIIFIFLLLLSMGLMAQETTETIKVRGNCDMCKDNIENAVKEMPTASGTWNIHTKVLTVTYDSKKTTMKRIMQNVAAAGYDNEMYLADDKDYSGLASCCLYDRDTPWDRIEESHGTHTDNDDHEHDHDSHPAVPAEGEAVAVTDHDQHEDFEDDDFDWDDFDDETVGLETVTISAERRAAMMDMKSAGLEMHLSDRELLKAACCNLSESFETNAVVDVAYSNAVSGTKQIKMLGLDQKYVSLTKELLPEIRGISQAYGMNFIPGRWIQGIQLIKGPGSVSNGYESIVGHINTELYKNDGKPKTSLNFYGDTESRAEGNFVHKNDINEKWGQSILIHGDAVLSRIDNNDDGFMDLPIGRNINVSYLLNMNDFEGSGFTTHFGVNYVNDHRLGGQKNFHEKFDKGTTNSYGIGVDINRFQLWNKSGYIFKDKPYQSVGWMNQFTYHEQDSYFGLRTYDGVQKTFYSNLIFESIFGHTGHKYKTGISFLYDHFDELYNLNPYKREETSPGAFFEYTYTGNKLTAVAGARVDFHNLAGTQFTPRLNLKYDLAEKTILRASIGRGFRTANVFAENQNYFASNRKIEILDNGGDIYGLKPEVAWNYGVSVHQDFRVFGRRSTVVADFFRTDFQDQVMVDLDNSPHTLLFYNLDGKSYANSFQIQWDFQPIRRLDARLAYKYYDTKADYLSGAKELPFTPNHRGFLNLAYSTIRNAKGKQWSFDGTLQWVGEQRLPDTSSNPVEFQRPEYGDSYFQLNAQVAHNLSRNFRVYVGGDNLLNYKQDNPILDSKNPFGNYFDAAMIYAPVMGTNVYFGFDIDF